LWEQGVAIRQFRLSAKFSAASEISAWRMAALTRIMSHTKTTTTMIIRVEKKFSKRTGNQNLERRGFKFKPKFKQKRFQKLTHAGHTSQWLRERRVMDSRNIAPGTVIATFEDGRYPNRQTGNHAAFYLHSGLNSMKTGKPAYILVMDHWKKKGQVSARSIYPKARKLSIGLVDDDSDNAEMFYVVK
jgi:hypothetical protein